MSKISPFKQSLLVLVLSAFAPCFFAFAEEEGLRLQMGSLSEASMLKLQMATKLENGGRIVRMQFEDGCGKPISYTTQDYVQRYRRSPITLHVELMGLAPNQKVWLETEVNLFSNMPHNQAPVKNQGEYVTDAYGYLDLKFPVRFAKSAMVDLWQARLNWTQPGLPENTGGFHTALMLFNHRQEAKRFYRIVSTPVCQWESQVAIASEYYWNGGAAPLHVNRAEQFSADSLSKNGYDLGPQLVGGGDKPLRYGSRDYGEQFRDYSNLPKLPLIPQSGPLVWFFSGWQSVVELKKNFSLERQWSLKPGEGAYYGQRTSFTRYEAMEFMEVESSGCMELKPTRLGWIDVGLSATNLYAVPADISGSPEESRKFMELIQPAVNTCADFPFAAGAPEFKVTGATQSLLFFYPGSNHEN